MTRAEHVDAAGTYMVSEARGKGGAGPGRVAVFNNKQIGRRLNLNFT